MRKDSSHKYKSSEFSPSCKEKMEPKLVKELFRRYKAGTVPEPIVQYFKIDKWEEVGSWGWHVVWPEDKPRTPQKPPADKFLRLVKDK